MPMDLVDSNYFLKPKTPLDHPWICQRNHLWCHIRMISLVFNPVVSTNSVNLLLKKSEKSLPKTPLGFPKVNQKSARWFSSELNLHLLRGFPMATFDERQSPHCSPIIRPLRFHSHPIMVLFHDIPNFPPCSSVLFVLKPPFMGTALQLSSSSQHVGHGQDAQGAAFQSHLPGSNRLVILGQTSTKIMCIYIYVCVSYIYMLGSITSYKHLPKMICPKMFGTVWTTVSMYCYLSKWGVTFLMLIETVLRVVIINKKHHKAQP